MTYDLDRLGPLAYSQFWQVTAVAITAGILARCLCRNRPHLAYLLWLVALVKCWTPPLWSSPGGVFCWPPQRVNAGADLSLAERRLTSGVARQRAPAIAAVADERPQTVAPPIIDAPPAERVITLPRALFGIWLLGAAALGSIAVYQACRWRSRLRLTAAPPDSRLEALLADGAKRIGLRRPPRIVVASAPLGPAAYGWLRPTIVVPEALVVSADQGMLKLVLAHELIHIRRGDLLTGAFQLATQIVWWFHPLVWWACRQLTRQRERSCDEEVLAAMRCKPDAYAQCLLDVLRLKRQSPLLAAFPGMRAAEVTRQRFEHIMHCGPNARARTPRRYWLLAAAALSVVLPGARWTIAEPGAALQPPNPNHQPPNPPPAGAAVERAAPPSALDQAINRGVKFLKSEQRPDGSWPDPIGYPGGITGLCALTLLKSGEKPDAAPLQAALDFLRPIRPSMTYSTAIHTLVFCAANLKADRALIERDADWLARQQKQAGPFAGAWGYPQAEGDNSNTGFAMLALYEAERAGVKTDPAVWRRALDYWVGIQNENGSWGYKPGLNGTGSMTSQGMFCVAAAAKVLDEQKPDQAGPKAIEKAVAWLEDSFDVRKSPGTRRGTQGYRFYYLRALGHAARMAGKEKFGDHDWFAEGSQALVEDQRPDGSWKGASHAEDDAHIAASLALLFLLNK